MGQAKVKLIKKIGVGGYETLRAYGRGLQRGLVKKTTLNKLRRDPNSWYAKYRRLKAETRSSGGAVQQPAKGVQAYFPAVL